MTKITPTRLREIAKDARETAEMYMALADECEGAAMDNWSPVDVTITALWAGEHFARRHKVMLERMDTLADEDTHEEGDDA